MHSAAMPRFAWRAFIAWSSYKTQRAATERQLAQYADEEQRRRDEQRASQATKIALDKVTAVASDSAVLPKGAMLSTRRAI